MKIVPALILAASTISVSAFAITPADLYGSPAAGAQPQRQVIVDSHTRYINVKHGDVVTFSTGAETVTWHFDGIDLAIPLSKILPTASADVQIYVEPEPQA